MRFALKHPSRCLGKWLLLNWFFFFFGSCWDISDACASWSSTARGMCFWLCKYRHCQLLFIAQVYDPKTVDPYSTHTMSHIDHVWPHLLLPARKWLWSRTTAVAVFCKDFLKSLMWRKWSRTSWIVDSIALGWLRGRTKVTQARFFLFSLYYRWLIYLERTGRESSSLESKLWTAHYPAT